jgi:hypothetical protein
VKLPDLASLKTYLTYRYPSRLFHIVVLLSVSTGRGLQLFWGPPRTLPDPGHRQAHHVEVFDLILALLPLIACYAIFPSDILIDYCMWCLLSSFEFAAAYVNHYIEMVLVFTVQCAVSRPKHVVGLPRCLARFVECPCMTYRCIPRVHSLFLS